MSTGKAETESVRFGAVKGIGDMRNVTIYWETNEEFPNRTSRYVITLSPADPFGREVFIVEPGSPGFEEKQMEVTLLLGVEYNVSVRTDNCNDTQQGELIYTSALLNGT